jgi:carotenoid cleavage dioxygenase-like enzyme
MSNPATETLSVVVEREVDLYQMLPGAVCWSPARIASNDLPVCGEVPKDLRGTLYRNSPNPQFAPRDDNYHWFVGDGMIHTSTSMTAASLIATAGFRRRNS